MNWPLIHHDCSGFHDFAVFHDFPIFTFVFHLSICFSPNFQENDVSASIRYPIVPPIKTLVGNTAPCQSITTSRNTFAGNHENFERRNPIINESEIRRDPNAVFYSETTASKYHDAKTMVKLNPARPGSGGQTRKLLETGIPLNNPFDLQKPCVDLNPTMSDCGVVRVVRPSGLTDEKMCEIRENLRQKNIGPSNAGSLMKPGSRMCLRSTSMVDFHTKSSKRTQTG